MSKHTHTRGPWTVEEGQILADGAVLGQVYGADDYPCNEEDISEECHANAALIAAAPDLLEERDKLQAFKVWVHSYLDGKGVPVAPPGAHGAEGCRIGDRMDWLFAEIERARKDLLAVAEYALSMQEALQACCGLTGGPYLVALARAAIAKAEGGAT